MVSQVATLNLLTAECSAQRTAVIQSCFQNFCTKGRTTLARRYYSDEPRPVDPGEVSWTKLTLSRPDPVLERQ